MSCSVSKSIFSVAAPTRAAQQTNVHSTRHRVLSRKVQSKRNFLNSRKKSIRTISYKTSISCSAQPAAALPQFETKDTVQDLCQTVLTVFKKVARAVCNVATMSAPDGTGLTQRFKMRMMLAPVFASVGMSNTLSLITSAVASFIKLYLLLLFLRVLLTWFPNVNWMGQPWVTLRQVTDPYLNLFRNLIPPVMGQIDLTPIFGFIVLQFLAQVLGADDVI
mmetsp:Transcript_20082/g.27804  ORF Transcript_20082/g.27804 Transcript_20082/m.27804 type:complete len:220 (+) Transcript_20082:124-783(+)